MKSTDKFLIGIVIGVIILVGAAFAVALLRPKPTYQSEDRPDGVAHNYLLALQQHDYTRAYRYLSSSLEGYPPSVEIFSGDIDDNNWQFDDLESGSTTLAVDSTSQSGERAEVSVRKTRFYNRGLFNSNQRTTNFEMELRRKNGAWKIISADSYWLRCWNNEDGCRQGMRIS